MPMGKDLGVFKPPDVHVPKKSSEEHPAPFMGLEARMPISPELAQELEDVISKIQGLEYVPESQELVFFAFDDQIEAALIDVVFRDYCLEKVPAAEAFMRELGKIRQRFT